MQMRCLWTVVGTLQLLAGCSRPESVPGVVWTDTGGEVINAHGGGMLYDNGRLRVERRDRWRWEE